jgi:hypothetical protein
MQSPIAMRVSTAVNRGFHPFKLRHVALAHVLHNSHYASQSLPYWSVCRICVRWHCRTAGRRAGSEGVVQHGRVWCTPRTQAERWRCRSGGSSPASAGQRANEAHVTPRLSAGWPRLRPHPHPHPRNRMRPVARLPPWRPPRTESRRRRAKRRSSTRRAGRSCPDGN